MTMNVNIDEARVRFLLEKLVNCLISMRQFVAIGPNLDGLIKEGQEAIAQINLARTCDFCHGSGMVRAEGQTTQQCYWCGGRGMWERRPFLPMIVIELWIVTGDISKQGVTVRVDPVLKDSAVPIIERALELLRNKQEVITGGMVS